MNVKDEILKILHDCSRDVDFLNGTVQHIVDKDKASDQITLWIEMYAAARCAKVLVDLSNEVKPKVTCDPGFSTGGTVATPLLRINELPHAEMPEYVLSDEQLGKIAKFGKGLDLPKPE